MLPGPGEYSRDVDLSTLECESEVTKVTDTMIVPVAASPLVSVFLFWIPELGAVASSDHDRENVIWMSSNRIFHHRPR